MTQAKQKLHPSVQEILRRRAQEQQPSPPAATAKEIYIRKRTQQLSRAIR